MRLHASHQTKTYKTIALTTTFWRPGQDFIRQIINALEGQVEDGDILTVSEKAISTALGNIADESIIHYSLLARFLAEHWMRVAWGHILGRLCHLREKTIQRFRTYPVEEGSKHKQLALYYSGFFQALMHGSEGGIDGSNLPYSYVSLTLGNATIIADQIRKHIDKELGKKIVVMIIDTDKTYSFRNVHFTPRPQPIHGIRGDGGFAAYFLGRFLRLVRRATPIAISGSNISVEHALQIAEAANRARGFGAGRNVWDMVEAFGVSLTNVTWEMLEKVEHKPIVIVRQVKSMSKIRRASSSREPAKGKGLKVTFHGAVAHARISSRVAYWTHLDGNIYAKTGEGTLDEVKNTLMARLPHIYVPEGNGHV